MRASANKPSIAAFAALPAIYLGGAGSPLGAIVGGLAIGLAQQYAAGYSPAHWPVEFVEVLLDHAAKHWERPGFRADATDLGRSWSFGDAGPVVTGTGHELAWWSTGRPAYAGTSGPVAAEGVLPRMGAL